MSQFCIPFSYGESVRLLKTAICRGEYNDERVKRELGFVLFSNSKLGFGLLGMRFGRQFKLGAMI